MGTNIGGLFGEILLDDSNFKTVLERSQTGAALLNKEIGKLSAQVIGSADALVKMGVSLDDMAVALGLDAEAAETLIGRYLALRVAQDQLAQSVVALTSVRAKAANADNAHYASMIEADRIRTTQLQKQYQAEVDRLALAAKLRAEELAGNRAAIIADEVGIEQEAAYRNSAIAERNANEISAAGLKTQLAAESLAATTAFTKLREKIEIDASKRTTAVFIADQNAQLAAYERTVEGETSTNLGSLGFRVTPTGVQPRGFLGAGSGPLLGAAAGAFGVYELIKMATASADAARETQNLADRLDITWQQARKLEQQGSLTGVSISSISQAAAHLAQALEEPTGAGRHTAEALTAIGVSGSTAGELLINLLDKLSKIGNNTERIAALRDILQRSSQAIEPLVVHLDESSAAVDRLGVSLDKNAQTQLKLTAIKAAELGVAWQALKDQIGAGIVGQITIKVLDAATGAALDPTNLLPWLQAIVGGSGGFLVGKLEAMIFKSVFGNKPPVAPSTGPTVNPEDLKTAVKLAQDRKDTQGEDLDALRDKLAETRKLITELKAVRASTIDPLRGEDEIAGNQAVLNDELYNELTLRRKIQDFEQTAKKDPLGKDAKAAKDDRASIFSIAGLTDYVTAIAQAQDNLKKATGRGLFDPAQIELATQGIQKLKDEFAALNGEVVKLAQPTNTAGSNALKLMVDERIKLGRQLEAAVIKTDLLVAAGKLDQPQAVPLPQMLNDAANITQRAAEWTIKWEQQLARVSDELNKISKYNQINDIAKSLGFSPQGITFADGGRDTLAASNALAGFRQLQTLNAPLFDQQRALIKYFEEEAVASGKSAEQISQQQGQMINGVVQDYSVLKDKVKSNLGLVAQTWHDLVGDIQGAVTKFIGGLGGALFDTLFPDFMKAGNDPLKPLVESFRSAFEQLSAYANPKSALQDLIKSIQQAGSISEANAIAVKYFGTTAGPLLAAELRNGTISANDLSKAIDAASVSTVAYANQTTSQLSQLTLLWRQLVKDVVTAIVERLIILGLLELLVWLKIINRETATLGSAMEQVFTKVAIKLAALFKKVAADIQAMVGNTVKAVEDIINGMHATATVDIVTRYYSINEGGGGGNEPESYLLGGLFNSGGFGGIGSGGFGGGFGGLGINDPFNYGMMTNAAPAHGSINVAQMTVVTNNPVDLVRQLKALRLVHN